MTLKATVETPWPLREPPGIRGAWEEDEAMAALEIRKTPQKMSESQIQRAVMDHLRRRAWPEVVFWHTPNGGARSKAEAGRFKAEGVMPGVPDVQIMFAGRALFLELKTTTGSVSAAQKAFHARLTAAGAECVVAKGLDAALAQLEAWGVLRPNRAG